MRGKINDFFIKKAKVLCSFAVVAATFASNGCVTKWYQPKEPEGLEEFVKKFRENI